MEEQLCPRDVLIGAVQPDSKGGTIHSSSCTLQRTLLRIVLLLFGAVQPDGKG